jgi:hypothetical protein
MGFWDKNSKAVCFSVSGVGCALPVEDCVDARGVDGLCRSCCRSAVGGGRFTGSGNRGACFLLRRGSLKNVVCVETVCVVVVVEPYIGPLPELPLLPSDRDDSEFRDGSANCGSGRARAELSSSPYEGGAVPPTFGIPFSLCDTASRCRSSRPLLFPRRHFDVVDFVPVARPSVECRISLLVDLRPREDCLLNIEGFSFCSSSTFASSRPRLSVVGAVLTIVGTGSVDIVGTGGRSSSNLARDERCDSEKFRKRIMLKRFGDRAASFSADS